MHKAVLLVSLIGLVSAGHWSVESSDTNKTCLIVDADVTGQIRWIESNETKSFDFVVNGTTHSEGICNGNTSNSLSIRFFPNGITPSALTAQEWEFKIVFTRFEKNDSFSLTDYELIVAPTKGFNQTDQFKKSDDADVSVTASGMNGFKCSETGLALTQNSTVQLNGLKVVAFAALDTPDFRKDQMFEQCPLDAKTSDIVPIVVGACLAGLVIVVLIAYLIGRARAKRQGYASV